MPELEVIPVYVCPNSKCQNYYSSSNMGDLSKIRNTNLKGEFVSFRAKCPGCGAERILRYARLIPLDEQVRAEQKVPFAQTA